MNFQQNFMNSLTGGLQFGQQLKAQRDTTQINRLAGQAYSAAPEQRDSALAQMYQINPTMAAEQEKAIGTSDDRRQKGMVNAARLLTAAPEASRPALYERMKPGLARYGLQLPEQYDDSVAQAAQALVQAYGTTDGAPTQFTALDLQAKAAGHQPGTQGYQDFFKRANGELARQSGAAIGYQKITGPDGREYLVATDPRGIGAQVVGDGTGYGSFGDQQQGGGQMSGMGAATPTGGLDFASDAEQFASLGIPVSSTVRTQDRNAQVGGVSNSYHLTGEAMDIAPRNAQEKAQATQYWRQRGYRVIDEGDHLHVEPPRRGATTSRLQAGAGNPFASRRPEDQAAATERATQEVKLEFLPQQQAIETQGAIDRAVGVEQGKAQLEQAVAAPGAIAKMEQSITAIDELLNSQDLGSIVGIGSINPMNRIPGTAARGLIARAEQISGQAFLAAFNQLKGGGAITEKEGQAATAAMARLDRSQSLADYQAALRDLRAAIAPALERQRAALSRGQQPAGGQPPGPQPAATPVRRARNPQTGQVVELRNGQWVPVQ